MPDRPTVLFPVRVLEGDSIPEGIPALLANAHVLLLGYHELPDQTATDQARSQFEDKATRRLEDFTAILEHAGATVETRLVFTHDARTTIDRVSTQEDCLAVLIPNSTRPLEEVLVGVRGVVGVDRFVSLCTGLFADTGVGLTLYHVAEEDETDEDVETLLNGMATRLVEGGFPADAIDVRVDRDGSAQSLILDAAEAFDAVVMGESDPSVTTFLFGMRAEQVAEQFLGPVLVVEREEPDDEDE